MSSGKIPLCLVAVALFQACSESGGGSPPAATCTTATQGASGSLQTTSASNVIPVYIADTSTTGSIGYANEPLVSVTLCSPNHTSSSQCQTISNILLDTGSYGLRIFGSVISGNVSLAQQTVTAGGTTGDLAECAIFGSGADWGSVQNADVVMGTQTAANIPIQVIDISFGSIPSFCSSLSPDTDPCSAGFNGILGVGLFAQDCGNDCDSTDLNTNPGIYLACDANGCGNCTGSGNSCTLAIPIPSSQQVVNPVPSFASGYNNGISLTLPYVSAGGDAAVSGTMTLGIGSTSGVTVYAADGSGQTDLEGADFQTVFNSDSSADFGHSGEKNGTNHVTSFLDSGSNGYYFPAISGLSTCSDNSFFCPSSQQTLYATIEGFSGSPSSGELTFYISNADTLFGSNNSAFSTLGGSGSNMFDWGLPFFFNRTIYVGVDDGVAATINGSATYGPYWAF